MLSRILSIPFIIGAGVFIFLTIYQDELWAPYIVPCILALIVLYFLEPQIDWWWYQKFPPELDERLRELMVKNHPYYQNLSLAEKQRFRSRMALYMEAQGFIPKGPEKLPEDVKGFIAANAVQITFGKTDFLFHPFERIVVYFQPFPSPQIQEHWHTSELYEEDGVFLFSAQEMIMGTTRHGDFYNIGLHEYGNAFTKLYNKHDFPAESELDWKILETISSLSLDHIKKTIGLPEIPIIPVSIHHFFVFPEKFKEKLPALYEKYTLIFNQDPINRTTPVLDRSIIENKK